jgi:hypothetical protein
MSLLDLFRPEWKNADPVVRADAVRELGASAVETLTEIARTDADSKVRSLALRKLEDPDLLLELAEAQEEEKLRELAFERAASLLVEVACGEDKEAATAALGHLSRPQSLARVAQGAALKGLRDAALERISDAATLADIAEQAEHTDLRRRAVELLEEPARLLKIALHSLHGEVAQVALDRLEDPKDWLTVAEKGEVKAVRQAAQAKLEKLPDEAHPTRLLERREMLEELIATVEGLQDSESWEQARDSIEEARSRWLELGAPYDDELGKRFFGAREHFIARYKEYLEGRPLNTPQPEGTQVQEAEAQETKAQETEAQETEIQVAETPAPEAEAQPTEITEPEAAVAEAPAAVSSETETPEASAQVAEAPEIEAPESPASKTEAQGTETPEPVAEAPVAQEPTAEEPVAQVTEPVVTEPVATADAASKTPAPEAEAQATDPETPEADSEALRAEKEKNQAQAARSHQARLTSLAERLESLVADEDLVLRKAERALRDAQNAFQNPPTLPDNGKDWPALKQRLEAARDLLVPRVRQVEQEEEWKQWANVPLQEALIARMEAMVETEDLAQAAKELRTCSEEWKAVASAPREKSEELWQQFRAAREKVRERVKIFQQDQDKERKENLVKKIALCEQAAALADSQDWKKTAELLKSLQAQWKAIGPVPRKNSDEVWKRFRGACDSFFDRRKAHFAELDKEREGNLKEKIALCEKAEALSDSTDWDGTTGKLKALQDEWKRGGPVPRRVSEELWRRFRGACDRFFDRRSRKDELPYEENLLKKEAACAELEALLPAEGAEALEAPEDFLARVEAARGAWRKAGEVPRSRQPALERRFAAVTEGLIAAFPAALAGTDWDPAALAERRGKLVDKAEALVQELRKKLAEQDQEEDQPSLQDLARQLKEALAANTIRKGPQTSAQVEAWAHTKGQLAIVRQRWMELAGAAPEELEKRFHKAFDDFAALEPKKAG